MRGAAFLVSLLGSAGQLSAQDSGESRPGLNLGALSDPSRTARVEAVHGCFTSAGTVTAAEACVGVWVTDCMAQGDKTRAECLTREANTWYALAMMTGMGLAEAASERNPENESALILQSVQEFHSWAGATAKTCGPEPTEEEMLEADGALCWGQAAARRAFVLLHTEEG